ncbi:MAG: acetyl-CoA acetyltransferase [Chloroflexi bacterium]|nr:thiolase family protein [Anaerolineales bacterium]RIK47379.1 MAG: acetyl-CoA acetyltransferase [Chloroflexota bacterium]
MFAKSFIPYGGYWCSPFARWQGSFSNLHTIKFAAEVSRKALEARKISPAVFSNVYLGMTVPAPASFYGAPWLAGMIGAEGVTGPVFSQACATSARVIGSAARAVETEDDASILCVTADRTSNGPHLLYPNPLNPGARGDAEDWVWDNFNRDPFVGNAMLQTAENTAKDCGITTAEQHEVTLMRYAQYQKALADDAAFHKKYMSVVEVNPTGKKVAATVADDEGVFPSTAEGLGKLKPVMPDGTVTYGGQTFPADGNAGMIVTTKDKARELSCDPKVEIQLLAFSEGRAAKGFMPKANAPAVRSALQKAGLDVKDIKAIKTHNPFAVNDIFLNRELGIPLDKMNNYGSSLIWGHPQGPTGMRLVIELIEELVLLGGGYGLFTGCAAGDTAAALVLEVRAG